MPKCKECGDEICPKCEHNKDCLHECGAEECDECLKREKDVL